MATPALIDALIDYVEHDPRTDSISGSSTMGGAISRVAPHDTAYFSRHADAQPAGAGVLEGAREQRVRSATPSGCAAPGGSSSRSRSGHYVNITNSDDRDTRAHAAYGDNYARLASSRNVTTRTICFT